MGTQINQLSSISASDVDDSDLIPLYSNRNGDTRKWSLSNVLTWVKENFASPAYSKVLRVPSDGFTEILPSNSDNQWLVLRPTGTLSNGSVVLPSVENLIDGQEVLISTTRTITSFSINKNGATELRGVPGTFFTDETMRIRYEALSSTWFVIDYFQTDFLNPSLNKVISAPIEGFTETLPQVTDDIWLILNPGSNLNAGTIVLPTGTDKQTVQINSTRQIANVTITSGSSTVYGAPPSLSAESGFKLQYDSSGDDWYAVAD